MQVMIANQSVKLEDRDLLGSGGEARVFRWKDRAVKIYHEIDPKLGSAISSKCARHRDDMIVQLKAFPKGLPPHVVGPRELVADARGQHTLGFTMTAISSGEDVRRLSSRAWREGVVSNDTVTSIFRHMHRVLEELHARGVVVGDLNDSNVLFTGEEAWFIDADSMQFDRFPCVVAHEQFLDPRLYGVDLGAKPSFTPESDWYAFSVMLFASLLYVHPYGGVHPKLPTLLRRSEARHSLLRPDVRAPKAAVSPRVLPDGLLQWFEAVFDQDHRGPFPASLLQLHWIRCACGVTHARSSCPMCATTTAPVVRDAVRFHGKCQAKRVFTTSGRILCAAIQGTLRYLYEQDGQVRREDGERVMSGELRPRMRFALSGASTWVGAGHRLEQVCREQVVHRTSTGPFGIDPVFDANALTAYRLDGEWLVDATSGLRFGQILPGQTWFRMGLELGFGFYRAGLLTFFFTFSIGRPGLRMVALPPLEGRLIDAAATFDGHKTLFEVATEKAGVITHRLHVVASEGRVLTGLSGVQGETRALSTIGGKALAGDRILCATDQGLLSLEIDPSAGTLAEGRLYVDAEPFVLSGSTVLPGPGGSVYIVTTRDITQLTLMP